MGVPAARHAGFTLIELLVVLVLIGIIVSFAVLSAGTSGEREAELEARRLAALIDLAGEEAVLKSREMAVLFSPDGYQFLALGDDNAWAALDDRVLRQRTLPAGFSLKLSVDGLPVDIAKPQETPEPQVFLLSDGERSAFEVDLGVADGGVRYRVTGPMLGDLQVSGAEPS